MVLKFKLGNIVHCIVDYPLSPLPNGVIGIRGFQLVFLLDGLSILLYTCHCGRSILEIPLVSIGLVHLRFFCHQPLEMLSKVRYLDGLFLLTFVRHDAVDALPELVFLLDLHSAYTYRGCRYGQPPFLVRLNTAVVTSPTNIRSGGQFESPLIQFTQRVA